MRLTFPAFAAICASACATADGPKISLVETDPPDAIIRVEGFGECQSPCRIELDAPRNLTIAKAGYDAQRVVLEPGTKRLLITLKLAAPTTKVDEEGLPEL